MIYKRLFVCICLCCLGLSCSTANKQDVRNYAKGLDYLSEETIKVPIDFRSEGRYKIIRNTNATPYIQEVGALTDVEKFNGKLVFTDTRNQRLFITDENFSFLDSLGRKGRGPDEFLKVQGIMESNGLLFVNDVGNGRSVLYEALDKKGEVEEVHFNSYALTAAATDNYFFIPTDTNDEFLLDVYASEYPLRKVRSVMPRILPYGVQPMALNHIKTSTSEGDNVYVVYDGLPYIFSFTEEFELRWVIELVGEHMEEFYTGASKYKGVTKMVRVLFNDLASNDQFLYISISGVIYCIDLEDFEVTGAWLLQSKDGQQGFGAEYIRIHSPYLYIYNGLNERSGRIKIQRNGSLANEFELIN
ncbi:MAG: 6-bladed beta-propeller [Balneolaceae bacterium]|nr:6-bladed beta-propeller [Balneolaceae bacterium]